MVMRTLALLSIAAAFSVADGQKSPSATSTTAAQRNDLLPDEQIQQVLNRLTFGPRSDDAAKVRAMGVDKWIEAQLHPERIPDARVDSIMSKYAVYSMNTSDVIRDYGVVQQLQRQAKKEAGADTSMDKRDARRKVLAQDPKVAGTRSSP